MILLLLLLLIIATTATDFNIGVMTVSVMGECEAAISMALYENSQDFPSEFGVNLTYTGYEVRDFDNFIVYPWTSPLHAYINSQQAFGINPIKLLIGPVYAEETRIMASGALLQGIPVITFSSAVFNRQIYPNIIQIAPDDISQGNALAKLFVSFGWKKAAVLATSVADLNDVVKSFIEYAPLLGVEVSAMQMVTLVQGRDNVKIRQQCDIIKASGAYIIILGGTEVEVDNVLWWLDHYGFNQPPYQIILTSSAMRVGAIYLDQKDQIKGILGIKVGNTQVNQVNDMLNRWQYHYMTHPQVVHNISVNDVLNSLSDVAYLAFMYDSGKLAAKAIRDLLTLKKNCPFMPTHYPCQMLASIGDEIMLIQLIKQQRFDGMSGTVEFDSSGVRLPVYDLYNGQPGTNPMMFSIVGSYSGTNNDTTTFNITQPITWRSGTSQVPRDSNRLFIGETDSVRYNSPVLVLAIGIAILGSWTASIFVEQVIFHYTTSMIMFGWLIMAAISLGLGIWVCITIGLTSLQLQTLPITYSLDYLIPNVIISCCANTIGLLLVLTQYSEHRDSLIFDPKMITVLSTLKNIHYKGPIIGGFVMAGGMVATQFMCYKALVMSADLELNWEMGLIAATVDWVLCVCGLLLYFHFRRSHFRFITNFIMGGGIAIFHTVSLINARFVFNNTTVTEASSSTTVQLIGSITFAVLAFIFIMLNVIRLRLSRDVFEAQARDLERKLNAERNEVDYLQRCLVLAKFVLAMHNCLRQESMTRPTHFIYQILRRVSAQEELLAKLENEKSRVTRTILNQDKISSENSREESKDTWAKQAHNYAVDSKDPRVEMQSPTSQSTSSLSSYQIMSKMSSDFRASFDSRINSANISIQNILSAAPLSAVSSYFTALAGVDIPYERIFETSLGGEFLKDHAIRRHDQENIMFILDLGLFKSVYAPSKNTLGVDYNDIVADIYNTYIKTDAECQINISADLRNNIARIIERSGILQRNRVPTANTDTLGPSIFDEAEKEIHKLIRENMWAEFIATNAYKTLIMAVNNTPKINHRQCDREVSSMISSNMAV